MEVNVDTKTEMGVISAKREVLVEEPAFARLIDQYAKYEKQDDAPRMAWARKQLLATRFGRTVRPGEPMALTELLSGDGTLPKGYSALVKWYPGAKSLRALVEVKNPYYRAPNVERMAARSWLRLLVCASGADQDMTSFYVIRSADGRAQLHCYGLPEPQVGTGKWKSFDGGYVVDVDLPYNAINSYDKSWTRMAVSAGVAAAGPDCQYQTVCTPGASDPFTSARSYCVLTRK